MCCARASTASTAKCHRHARRSKDIRSEQSRSPKSAHGDRVDLFVRPEQLRFASAGEPIAVEGTVAAHIYQGGHVNLYLEAPEVCTSRLLMRSLEPDAITRWPTGTRVGVSIAGTDAIAFEAAPDQRDGAPQSA